MNEKNTNISIIRIFAMILILLCHFVQEIPNKYVNMLAQFFNVGVFIFIFLSGYLFGKKDIKDTKEWYKRRLIKIVLPMYIWVLVINIIYLITNYPINIKNIIVYVLNLQGVFGGTQGLEHLWFLTVIMICYLITPVLYKFREKYINVPSLHNVTRKGSQSVNNIKLLIGILFSFGISYINVTLGRYILYVCLYIYAYYYSYIEMKKGKKEKTNIIIQIVIIIASMVIRLIAKKYFDNTIFYTNFIVLATQTAIAISTFKIVNNMSFKLKNKKIIDKLENMSFEIYIVHYAMCVGPIDILSNMDEYAIIKIILFFILTYIFAYGLSKMSNRIQRILKKEN